MLRGRTAVTPKVATREARAKFYDATKWEKHIGSVLSGLTIEALCHDLCVTVFVPTSWLRLYCCARTSVNERYREPDLAELLDRADEAAEAEVDEETPPPSMQRQPLRAHVNLGHPTIWRILACMAKWPLPTGCCQMGKTLFQMSRVRSTTDAENWAGSSLAKMLPFQSSLWHRHDGSSESVRSRKPQSEYRTSSVMGHVTTREHAGRT